jgi:polyhydroxyalkanoate synthesis regulator phasin
MTLTPPCVAATDSYTSATSCLRPRQHSAPHPTRNAHPPTLAFSGYYIMVDKPLPTDAHAAPGQPTAPGTLPAPRRPGHRGADMRDTVAEMAERAQIISQEAGTKVAHAMRDVISAGAGITGFAIESARDLVQYMVKRGQMTPEEADKLIREAEAAHDRRPASEKSRPTATKLANERAAVAKADAAARAAAQAAAMPPFRPAIRPIVPPASPPPATTVAPKTVGKVVGKSVAADHVAASAADAPRAARAVAKATAQGKGPTKQAAKPAASATTARPATGSSKPAAKPAAKPQAKAAKGTKATKKPGKR